MKDHTARQLLIREIRSEFTRTYPFLTLEFSRRRGERPMTVSTPPVNGVDEWAAPGAAADEGVHAKARQILWEEFGVTDDMTVNELEALLQYEFGLPAQVLRRSGKLWLETRMTQHWTLRQQNEHGRDIAG